MGAFSLCRVGNISCRVFVTRGRHKQVGSRTYAHIRAGECRGAQVYAHTRGLFDGHLTICFTLIGNLVLRLQVFAYIWRKTGVALPENCHKRESKGVSENFSNVKIAF